VLQVLLLARLLVRPRLRRMHRAKLLVALLARLQAKHLALRRRHLMHRAKRLVVPLLLHKPVRSNLDDALRRIALTARSSEKRQPRGWRFLLREPNAIVPLAVEKGQNQKQSGTLSQNQTKREPT
jgi:hypothetical protein